MSLTISKLTYQVNLPNPLEIKTEFNSPIFSTSNNMIWKLLLQPTEEFYGVYLMPIANSDEIIWGKRSKLPFKIYIKEIMSNRTAELYSDSYNVPPDTDIEDGYGCPEAFRRSSLRNGELIIGIIFNDIEYKESRNHNYSTPIPKKLIDAWKDQLFDFQPADVEFSVQNEKFYACSSILSKRSKYFAAILSGIWAESAVDQNEDQDESSNDDVENDDTENSLEMVFADEKGDSVMKDSTMSLNSSDDEPKFQIKHYIEISEYDPITISTMLEYLYTNQVKWINEDGESISTKLFCLADKYLLSDLKKRAKIRILDELDISNVSEIMFSLVPKYEDLKEPVLNFMAKNFEEISNSQEFKDILSNLVNYPNYNEILSEIWAEYFKIQKQNKQ